MPRHPTTCLALVFGLLLAACGGDGEDPSSGTILFKRDAATCPGSPWSMTFYVDGSEQGTSVLGPGETAPAVTVAPGQHTAFVTSGLLQWSETVDVEAGVDHTVVLSCF